MAASSGVGPDREASTITEQKKGAGSSGATRLARCGQASFVNSKKVYLLSATGLAP